MLTTTKTAAGTLAAAALALAAGCNGTESLSDAPTTEKPRKTMPVSTDKHPVPHDIMDALYAEVAGLSGRERREIELVRAEARNFRDTSLDCPQPNVGYAQMIVEGYWVILRAGGEEFDYRIDNNRRHRRCTGSTRQAPIRFPPDS